MTPVSRLRRRPWACPTPVTCWTSWWPLPSPWSPRWTVSWPGSRPGSSSRSRWGSPHVTSSACCCLVWQTHPQSPSQHEDSVSQMWTRVPSHVSGVSSGAAWPGAQVRHVWGVWRESRVSSSSSATTPSPSARPGSACARRRRDLSSPLLSLFWTFYL